MEQKTTQPTGRKRVSWAKRVVIFLGALGVLLVIAYFVVTSSAFFKAVILPRAGASLNARIEVRDASISPFSQVVLDGMRVVTTGTEPLLTAEQVRLRYSLMDILRGNINVHEVTLSTPVLQIVKEADGSSNLDPILKQEEKEAGKDEPKSKEPTRLNVQNLSLKNGTVRQIEKLKDGGTNLTHIEGLDLSLDKLGNNQAGKLNLAAGLTLGASKPGTNDLLVAKVSGGYDVKLDQELMPDMIKGSTTVNLTRAEGSYSDLNGLNAVLNADLTPNEIRELALRFSRGNQQLGQARVSGPLDLNNKEGRLQVEILSIDRNILNLAGAASHWDFQNSTVNSTNQVQISQKGTFFAVSGNLAGREVSIAQDKMVTPPVNLNLDYQVNVNLNQQSAVLQKLDLAARKQDKDLLRTYLDQQMNISWGTAVQGFREASLQIILTNFNIAEWRAVLGTNLTSGQVAAQVGIISQQDGKMLKTQIDAAIQNLAAQFGTNRLEDAAVRFTGRGTIEDMKAVNFPEYALALDTREAQAVKATGALRLDLQSKDTAAQITGQAVLPQVLKIFGVPGLSATAGLVKISANYSSSAGKSSQVGTLALENFTGRYEPYEFKDFQTSVEFNIESSGSKTEIRRAAATFAQGFQQGGTLDLSGNYDTEKQAGQFTFSTVNLNENTFRPVLGPSLGENQLVSISLNGKGSATLDPQNESSIKADLKISNWVVQDKEGTLPKTPLAVDLGIDGGMRKEVLDLRRVLLQLTPTERAKNALLVQAKLDLAKTNAGPSNLSIESESFDVTPYYNMFAGGTNAPVAESKPATPATTPSAPGPEKEPDPIDLPFKHLTGSLKFDRFYFKDLAITNWTGKITIQTNVVRIDPFQMQINGGALKLSGNMDVGTPGYRYDLAFNSQNVPIEPLATTFGSTNNAGQLQGILIADAKITGAGTTGPNLKKNLQGAAELNLTNLNYQIVGPKLRRILVPISIALKAPELVQTPINWMAARTQIGNGQINLQSLGVQSEAFYAESSGTIALSDVITNSVLNLPLELSLRRSLAEKSRLVSEGSAGDVKYVKLPRFVSVKGTVGEPNPDINELVIAGMLAKTAANLGIGSDKAEKALGVVGNILSGQGTSTNKGSTNASPGGNLLKGLGGLLGGQGAGATNQPQAKTNPPATNTPPKLNPFDLLRGLQKP